MPRLPDSVGVLRRRDFRLLFAGQGVSVLGDRMVAVARDLRAGWDTFRSIRWVWTFVAYFAIGNMLWGAWSALGPVVADRDLGGAAAWGALARLRAADGVRGRARRPARDAPPAGRARRRPYLRHQRTVSWRAGRARRAGCG